MGVMETPAPLLQRVLDDLSGAWRTRSLIAAIELDIFTVVALEPCTAEEIAERTGASCKGMKRLLDVLAAMDYLLKCGERYALPPELRTLPLLAKGQFWGYIHLVRDTWGIWGHLPEAVISGKPLVGPEDENTREDIFSRSAESLFLLHYNCARAVEAELGPRLPATSSRILDLGAGSGVWSIPFARALPNARVTAIDLPGVIPVTRSITRRLGVDAQYEYVAADLSAVELPADTYDLVILGHVLHVLGPDVSRSLLKRVFRSLRASGLVLVCESSPREDRTGPLFDVLFSLSLMLYTTDGQASTVREYRQWLLEAGFRGIEVGLKASPSLVVAAKEDGNAQRSARELSAKEEGAEVCRNG